MVLIILNIFVRCMSCITSINTNVFLITIIGLEISGLTRQFPSFFPTQEKQSEAEKPVSVSRYTKGDVDAFSREPFVVHFQAPKTGKNKQGKRC